MDPTAAFLFFLSMLSGYMGKGPSPVIPHDMPPAPPPEPVPAPLPPQPLPPPLPMPPWPSPVVPTGLPPFPGPGWTADVPVSPAVVARAEYWNPKLWDFPTRRIVRPFVIEQYGGRWLAFKAAWHPGDKGPQTYMATEAFRLVSAAPVQPSPVTPAPPPEIVAPPLIVPFKPAPQPAQPAPVPHPAAPPPPPDVPHAPPSGPSPSAPAAYPPAQAPPLAPLPVAMTPRQIQHALNELAPSPPNVPFPLVEDGNLGAVLTSAQVQQALAGTLDIRYGHKSRLAVVQWQHAHGLRVDSDPGPQTQASIAAAMAQAGVTA